MKVCCDLHIHSALSPCADNDMTPVNIVAAASACGLEMIAVADHNAIANVCAAVNIGVGLNVTVVPAIELQTSEEIHFLCYFGCVSDLENFYKNLSFVEIENRPDIYGEQLIVNDDDEIVGREKRLLSASSKTAEYELKDLAEKYGGYVVPAHVDRDANGIIAVLGTVPDDYKTVEISTACKAELSEKLCGKYKVLTGSDSHCIESIGSVKNILELEDNSPKSLLKYLKCEDKQ